MTNKPLICTFHIVCQRKMNSVDSLTKNFIKDFVQSRNIGDFSLIHSNIFIKHPHLLEKNTYTIITEYIHEQVEKT